VVGGVRLQRRRVTTPHGPVVVLVLSVLALLRVEAAGLRVGWGFGLSRPLWARRARDDVETVEERAMEDRTSRAVEDGGRMLGILTSIEKLTNAIERASTGEGAVGPQTTAGDRTVIPLVETFAQGGFGAGGGGGVEAETGGGSGGGGGGGGVGRSRTIAIADVGPDGVKIRPVIDVTGLALPAVSALAALLLGRRRRRRHR
jgi:uncharacterized spore protein YtfJ